MFRDLLQEAYEAMRHNRRRTALTMLGMAWGIATVVMLLAWGNGFGQACANIFANFGTKLVIVVPNRTSTDAGGQKAGRAIRFTLEDVDMLKTNLPQISQITPEASKQASTQYETRHSPLPQPATTRMCFHPLPQSGTGTFLQRRRRDAALPCGGDRVRGQGKTLFRTQCSGRTHSH